MSDVNGDHALKKRALNKDGVGLEDGGSDNHTGRSENITEDKSKNDVLQQKKLDDIRGPELARGEIVTRLLLSASEMARIIGRGGEHINKIRGKSGANIKACDVENDDKVAVICGEPGRVAMAFDLILEKITPQRNDYCSVRLLVSNDEAGRIVGTRGVNINELRAASQATQVQIEKLGTSIGNMHLRILTIEGNLRYISHVHVCYHRMFGVVMSCAGEIMNGSRGMDRERDGYRHPLQQEYIRDPPPPPYMHHPATEMSSLSADILLQRGISAETVRQLMEMKKYLSDNFEVGLNFIDERVPVVPPFSPQQYAQSQMPPSKHVDTTRRTGSQQAANNLHQDLLISGSKSGTGPTVLLFNVPAVHCGGLIGRGGAEIHKLSVEFGVHIEIAKQLQPDGTREVELKALDPNNHNVDDNLLQCKNKMLQAVSVLQSQSTRGP